VHDSPMNLARSGLAFLVCLSLLGCAHHPRYDKAAKADLDRRAAAFMPSGQAFPPPATSAPKQLVIGQWTQHKLVNEKGEVSLITYKVVGEQQGAYWIEIANESYYGKTVVKLLLALGDRTNPNTMEVLAAKFKDNQGRVTDLRGPAVPMNRALWQGSVNMLAVTWRGLPQEAASVVAGNFMGCFKASTDASWGIWRATSMTWMHPMVPINGLVKSVGMDRPAAVELVGFGDYGATSEIP
jgi:hypothetical protein